MCADDTFLTAENEDVMAVAFVWAEICGQRKLCVNAAKIKSN